MSNHHQEKLEYRWQVDMFQELLEAVYVAIGGDIPAVLGLEGQSYFTVGYWQMHAEINHRQNEFYARQKEKKEGTQAIQKEDA